MEKERRILIRISGNKKFVILALKEIESLFVLSVPSNLKDNDNGDGVHVFLTACVEEE